MGASITLAGESLISQKQSKREPLLISKFVLANVSGLDTTLPVDRAAGVPQADQIVHSVPVTREGYLATNKVVYSLMLGSDVGDFDFNWIGLVSAEDVLVIAAYVPRQQKRMEIPPLQAGNNLTRNIILEYDGAQSLTGINVPASSWQFDFTADFTAINAKIELLQVEIAKKVDLETWTPPAAVSLDGPNLVYPGSTNTYKITDYNRFSVFTASTTLGTVSVAGDVVTLVIPTVAAAGLVKLEVSRDGNKASFRLPVGAASIVPPTIISPADLATNVALDLVLTASPFEVFPAGFDQQVSRRWQIATDEAFTLVVFDKTSTTDLISIRPSEYDYFLPPGKRLYARAFDIGATLQSADPVASSFNTATTYVRRPNIISPTDGQQNVSLTGALTGDAFSVYGGNDVHFASRWQYSLSPDFSTTLTDSGWVTTSLTKYTPPSKLPKKTQVYGRVKYKGQVLGETEWSPSVRFMTVDRLQGVFTYLSKGPSARIDACAAAVNGHVYLFGGRVAVSNGGVLTDIWDYSVINNTWRQLSAVRTASQSTAVAIGGLIYLYGGVSSSSGDVNPAYNKVHVFNPATNSIIQKTTASPYQSRRDHVAAEIDGKMYICGGALYTGGSTTTLLRYTPATDSWEELAAGPTGTNGFSGLNVVGAAAGGKLYILSDRKVFCYDPATNTWSKKATPAVIMDGGYTMSVVDNVLYVFGGFLSAGYVYNSLYAYDPDADSWSSVASGGESTYGHSAAVWDRAIYFFGGSDLTKGLDTHWKVQ